MEDWFDIEVTSTYVSWDASLSSSPSGRLGEFSGILHTSAPVRFAKGGGRNLSSCGALLVVVCGCWRMLAAATRPPRTSGVNSWSPSRGLAAFSVIPLFHLLSNGWAKKKLIYYCREPSPSPSPSLPPSVVGENSCEWKPSYIYQPAQTFVCLLSQRLTSLETSPRVCVW